MKSSYVVFCPNDIPKLKDIKQKQVFQKGDYLELAIVKWRVDWPLKGIIINCKIMFVLNGNKWTKHRYWERNPHWIWGAAFDLDILTFPATLRPICHFLLCWVWRTWNHCFSFFFYLGVVDICMLESSVHGSCCCYATTVILVKKRNIS